MPDYASMTDAELLAAYQNDESGDNRALYAEVARRTGDWRDVDVLSAMIERDAQSAEIARLRAALEPFAAAWIKNPLLDDELIFTGPMSSEDRNQMLAVDGMSLLSSQHLHAAYDALLPKSEDADDSE